jgi:alginate O-acetyltransferase complex protein AlgI
MFINLFYWPFLALSASLYWLLPRQKLRTAFLTLCSLGFIWYFDERGIVVIVALTLFTYLTAIWLGKSARPKLVHRLGIVGIITVLLVFKYLGFLTGIINNLLDFFNKLPVFDIEKLLLPLGISYITFKYISYLTDIYWGLTKKGTLLDFACYGSLFSTFVAGPIERFERLKPQLETEGVQFQFVYVEQAFERITFGLFKKLVLADWLGYFANPVWDSPDQFSSLARVLALFAYSLQIYFDFAGYSDIAIGSSRLFGLTIMENFASPYLATNISQFWRRWHISLSDWIRDYLFFPLSQNRKNKFWLLFCVPIMAMAIVGLWHGSAMHYIAWGIWHGIGISTFQIWNSLKKNRKGVMKFASAGSFRFFSVFVTYGFCTVGWILFKKTRFALAIVHGDALLPAYLLIVPAVILLILHLVSTIKIRTSIYLNLALLFITMLSVCMVNTNFIYQVF